MRRIDSETVQVIEKPNVDGDLVSNRAGRQCIGLICTTRHATTNVLSMAGTLGGDLAYRDEDGYFWFVGRADDIIKTSGHMGEFRGRKCANGASGSRRSGRHRRPRMM